MERQVFDSGYLRRLVESDEVTQQHFASYFGDLLAIKLRPRLRSSDAVEDVVQETFARVIATLRYEGLDDPAALGSFVNSVCNNVLLEHYRDQSRWSEEIGEQVDGGPAGDRSLLRNEEQTQVRLILDDLPEKDRTILLAIFFEDRDKDEVCRTLGVERQYLRVLLHRAKTRFRLVWRKRISRFRQ